MTVLNIFSLDDIEQQNIIACLPEGKHIIGRGELLKVSDKRVSRKHAIINVSDDKITLTSVHVNPCFFKAGNGTTLTVLNQHQDTDLHDGDQFSLLPEDYWFRVKVRKRHYEEALDENNSRQDAKKARLSNDSNEIEENLPRNDPTTQEGNLTHNTSDLNASIHFQETARIEDIKHEDLSNEEVNNDNNVGINATNISSLPAVADNIKEEPQAIEVSDDIKEEHHGDEINLASNIVLQDLSTEPNNIQPVIKNEINDNDSASGSRSGEAPAAQPGPPRPRREKCWYGERCFRKNPNHRETFKHPGDQDYDSDPDDDRPECPYGMNCYRLNPDHRREYKHLARPAPKPSNVNVTLNVASGCQYCPHCIRKRGGGGGKSDYESDVDDY